MSSRTAGWTGAAVLGVTALLVVWGLVAGSGVPDRYDDPVPGRSDTDLYAALADRVEAGQGYYESVAAEQGSRGYPTRPVPTVRQPGLTWFEAGVGGAGALTVAFLLAGLAAVLVWGRALTSVARSPAEWFVGVLAPAGTIAVLAVSRAPETHEAWVGVLLLAAVGARRTDRVGVVVVLLLLASLLRELVAPFLLLVLVEQVWLRRRLGAVLAGSALTAFLVFYAWHAHQVSELVPVAAQDSRGWIGLGGWPAVVDAVRFGSPLTLASHAWAAVLVPLAVLGWWSRREPLAVDVGAVLWVGLVLLALVARSDNVYWGLMVAPVLLAGLAFVPAALRRDDLSRFSCAPSRT
jgi:hypothetical protein